MYNLISGTGRSGTSVMMLALRQAGIPITGFRYGIHIKGFPFDESNSDFGICFPSDEMKQINGNGLWEIPGMSISTGITDHYKDIGFKGDLIKVFTSVIHLSNPELIDKTIIMLREPKSVLTSMINCGEIPTREMASDFSLRLARDTTRAIKFLEENEKEYRVVAYEQLLEKPKKTIKDACEFLGRGDYKLGAKVINKKLNRSKTHINELGDISKLEEVYQLALDKKL